MSIIESRNVVFGLRNSLFSLRDIGILEAKMFFEFGFLSFLLYLCVNSFNWLNIEKDDEGIVSGEVSGRGTGIGDERVGYGDAVFGEWEWGYPRIEEAGDYWTGQDGDHFVNRALLISAHVTGVICFQALRMAVRFWQSDGCCFPYIIMCKRKDEKKWFPLTMINCKNLHISKIIANFALENRKWYVRNHKE